MYIQYSIKMIDLFLHVSFSSCSVAQLSFLTNLFVFPESRQSALVFVILRNTIVDGRSVTVTVVEEGMYVIVCSMCLFN